MPKEYFILNSGSSINLFLLTVLFVNPAHGAECSVLAQQSSAEAVVFVSRDIASKEKDNCMLLAGSNTLKAVAVTALSRKLYSYDITVMHSQNGKLKPLQTHSSDSAGNTVFQVVPRGHNLALAATLKSDTTTRRLFNLQYTVADNNGFVVIQID